MAMFRIECTYCGHTWKEELFYQPENKRCPICKDKELKYLSTKDDKTDVYGYNDRIEEDAYIKRKK